MDNLSKNSVGIEFNHSNYKLWLKRLESLLTGLELEGMITKEYLDKKIEPVDKKKAKKDVFIW